MRLTVCGLQVRCLIEVCSSAQPTPALGLVDFLSVLLILQTVSYSSLLKFFTSTHTSIDMIARFFRYVHETHTSNQYFFPISPPLRWSSPWKVSCNSSATSISVVTPPFPFPRAVKICPLLVLIPCRLVDLKTYTTSPHCRLRLKV